MNISDRSNQLVSVKFNKQWGHHLFHFHVLLHYSVKCIWDEVHHNVKVHLVRLLSVSIEELTHFYTVRVMKSLQNFEFTVLVALILKHLLDSHGLSGFSDCGLEYDTE